MGSNNDTCKNEYLRSMLPNIQGMNIYILIGVIKGVKQYVNFSFRKMIP